MCPQQLYFKVLHNVDLSSFFIELIVSVIVTVELCLPTAAVIRCCLLIIYVCFHTLGSKIKKVMTAIKGKEYLHTV